MSGGWILQALKRERWWLGFNIAAMAFFLVLAAQTWTEPEVRGQAATSGAAVVWFITALPVLAAAFLADLVWFGLAFAGAAKSRSLRPMAMVVLTGGLWLAVAVIDQTQH